jgi:hypothetical protein
MPDEAAAVTMKSTLEGVARQPHRSAGRGWLASRPAQYPDSSRCSRHAGSYRNRGTRCRWRSGPSRPGRNLAGTTGVRASAGLTNDEPQTNNTAKKDKSDSGSRRAGRRPVLARYVAPAR